MCCSANKPVLVPPKFFSGGNNTGPMDAAEIELMVLLTDTEISRASGYGHFYNTDSSLQRTVTQAYFPIRLTLSISPQGVHVRMYYTVPEPVLEIRGEGRGGSSRH